MPVNTANSSRGRRRRAVLGAFGLFGMGVAIIACTQEMNDDGSPTVREEDAVTGNWLLESIDDVEFPHTSTKNDCETTLTLSLGIEFDAEAATAAEEYSSTAFLASDLDCPEDKSHQESPKPTEFTIEDSNTRYTIKIDLEGTELPLDDDSGSEEDDSSESETSDGSEAADETDDDDTEETEETGDDTEESGDDTEETGDDTEETGDDTEETGDDTEETGDETEETGDETEETGDETEETGDETEETGDETEETGDDTEATDEDSETTADEGETTDGDEESTTEAESDGEETDGMEDTTGDAPSPRWLEDSVRARGAFLPSSEFVLDCKLDANLTCTDENDRTWTFVRN